MLEVLYCGWSERQLSVEAALPVLAPVPRGLGLGRRRLVREVSKSWRIPLLPAYNMM